MKNAQFCFGLSTIFLIAFLNLSKSQSEVQYERDSKSILRKAGSKSTEITLDSRKASQKISFKNILNHSKNSIFGNIDTLNFPLEGTKTYYTADSGGYVTGNNVFGDLAKANYFETSSALILTGIIFDFFYAVGGNSTIEIAIWDKSGPNNKPGIILATSSVNLTDIKDDIMNNQMTYIPFDPPVLLTNSFYTGVILPSTIGDTLVLWSNTDGDTNPGIAWEKWDSGVWYPFSSNISWSMNIAIAIFPVVDYNVPLNADFTSDLTNVNVGNTVHFTDISAGNPTSWEWTFEGGNPVTSAEKNPIVTYSEVGTYDVTLTIGNDTSTNTKSVADYITVGGSSIEIDTLNYPLEGEYAVYTIIGGYGYVTGTNGPGDLAKANFFTNGQNRFVTGVLMEFAHAIGGNPSVELAVWDNSGSGGSPGNKLGNQYLTLNSIKNDINGSQLSYAAFDPPINVTSSFYSGFMLPTSNGDTLVVWSNTDGDTQPSIAWELWNNNEWHSFTGPNTWNLNIALAIFPIVQNTLGTNENQTADLINIYPNPSTGIFSIVSESFNQETIAVSLYRIDGKLISTMTYRNNGIIVLDMTQTLSGIYFIKIETGSKSYIRKLVKQ